MTYVQDRSQSISTYSFQENRDYDREKSTDWTRALQNTGSHAMYIDSPSLSYYPESVYSKEEVSLNIEKIILLFLSIHYFTTVSQKVLNTK